MDEHGLLVVQRLGGDSLRFECALPCLVRGVEVGVADMRDDHTVVEVQAIVGDYCEVLDLADVAKGGAGEDCAGAPAGVDGPGGDLCPDGPVCAAALGDPAQIGGRSRPRPR